jgi:hypothetical protein
MRVPDAAAAPLNAAAPQAAPARSRRRLATILLAVLVAEYFGLLAWAYSGLYMDDAFIGFRYAQNLLAGNGFAFNPGERVEGITNVGWILLLAPFGTVIGLPLAAKLLAVALMAATVAMLYRATQPIAAGLAARSSLFALLPAMTVLLATTQPEFGTFSLLGMETPLLAAVLAGMVLLAANARLWPVPALGALAFVIRPEAVVVLPLAVAAGLALGILKRRDAARTMLAFVAAVALVTAARWAYFGDVLPNTFNSKPFSLLGVFGNLVAYGAGRSVNIAFPFAGLLALGVMIVGAFAIARVAPRIAAMAAAATATGLAFGLYAAPDWTELARYFAPYAPVALILLCAGLFEIVAGLVHTDIRRLRIGVCATLVLGVAVPSAAITLIRASDGSRLSYPGYVMTGATLVTPSLWMREHLPSGVTIATRRIGILAYYGQHRVFDYTYGLTDRDVARLVRAGGRHFENPGDPALAALWKARAPDYLLEDGSVIDQIALAAKGTREGFTIHGITYRVVQTFPIGNGAEWTLAARTQIIVRPEPRSPSPR